MFRLDDSNDLGSVCSGISNVGGYKRNAWYNLTCLLQTCCHLRSKEKLSVGWHCDSSVFRDRWRDQLRQWLEEGRHKPVLGGSSSSNWARQLCGRGHMTEATNVAPWPWDTRSSSWWWRVSLKVTSRSSTAPYIISATVNVLPPHSPRLYLSPLSPRYLSFTIFFTTSMIQKFIHSFLTGCTVLNFLQLRENIDITSHTHTTHAHTTHTLTRQ